MNAIINVSTQKELQYLAVDMPQSLLLYGPVGVGLSGVCDELANMAGMSIEKVYPEKDDKVDLVHGNIGIDIVRRLYNKTKTRSVPHLIAIDYAEKMTTEAQNAFLKLLEEPNSSTYFVLLSHDINSLLPTVLSRLQKVAIRRISHQQTINLLDELAITDSTTRAQMIFMSDGLPAEICRLSSDTAYFSRRSDIVRDARAFITGSPYEKLKIANKYRDDRAVTLQMLEDCLKQLQLTLEKTSQPDILDLLGKTSRIYDNIRANGNIRVQLASILV